jgi:hypothetical protein
LEGVTISDGVVYSVELEEAVELLESGGVTVRSGEVPGKGGEVASVGALV